MSVIIRLQNLPWAANAADIRTYFHGLSIPEGGVHIVGGEQGDAFIAFSTDEDARQAMQRDGGKLKEVRIKLLLSSRAEMMKIIEQARQQSLSLQQLIHQQQNTPAVTTVTNSNSPAAQAAAAAAAAAAAQAQEANSTRSPSTAASESKPIKDDFIRKERSRRSRSRSRGRDRDRSRSRDRSRERRRMRRGRDRSRSRDRYRRRSRSKDRFRRDRSRDRFDRRGPDRMDIRGGSDIRGGPDMRGAPEIRRGPDVRGGSEVSGGPDARGGSEVRGGIERPVPREIREQSIEEGAGREEEITFDPMPPIKKPLLPDPMSSPKETVKDPVKPADPPQQSEISSNPPTIDQQPTMGFMPDFSMMGFPGQMMMGSRGMAPQMGPGVPPPPMYPGMPIPMAPIPGMNFPRTPMTAADLAAMAAFQANSMIPPMIPYMAPVVQKPEPVDSDCCVEIHGLPPNANYVDIKKLFENIPILPDGIKFINDNHGKRTGIAYVKFMAPNFKQVALEKSGQKVRGTEVEVFNLKESIFNTAIDNQLPPAKQEVKNNGILETPSIGEKPAMKFQDPRLMNKVNSTNNVSSVSVAANNTTTTVGSPQNPTTPKNQIDSIFVYGLPTKMTERDVYNFIAEGGVTPIHTHVITDSTGTPTGDAFCQFETPQDAERAVSLRNNSMIGRWSIRVQLMSKEEFDKRSTRVPLIDKPPTEGRIDPRRIHRPEKEKDALVDPHLDARSERNPENRREFSGDPRVESREASTMELGMRPSDPRPLLSTNYPAAARYDRSGFMRGGIGGMYGVYTRGTPVYDAEHDASNTSGAGIYEWSGRGRGMFRGRGRGRGSFDHNTILRRAPPSNYIDNEQLGKFGQPGCVVAFENIHFGATIDDIISFCGDFNVQQCDIIRRFNDSGRPTGDARIAFSSREEAQRAVESLNRTMMCGRCIRLYVMD